VTPISAKKRKRLTESIEKTREKLRKRYPEIHGKTVDYVTHTVGGNMLFFTIHFTDETMFSVRYSCEMFVVGTDLDDVRTGDCELIREYMKPIPR
jgi:hypothetical protein